MLPLKRKKYLRIIHQTLKGKIINDMRYELRDNATYENVYELFKLIYPLVNTISVGDPRFDSYLRYEIETIETF